MMPVIPAAPLAALEVTCSHCHVAPGFQCRTPGGAIVVPHATRVEFARALTAARTTTRWADVTAAIPMSTRCAACGQPFGTHAGLDCRHEDGDLQSTFAPSIFADSRPGGVNLPPRRDPADLARIEGVIREYTASLEPVPSLVPCTATPPSPDGIVNAYRSSRNVCARLGAHGTHVHVFSDGSAWSWAPGDVEPRSHAVGTFSRIGERLVPEDEEPVSDLCPCGDGCDADACPACRDDDVTCSYCDGIGHDADDCPVAEDDNIEADDGPEDDYFESDGCTCKNCVAAAEYTGPVE